MNFTPNAKNSEFMTTNSGLAQAERVLVSHENKQINVGSEPNRYSNTNGLPLKNRPRRKRRSWSSEEALIGFFAGMSFILIFVVILLLHNQVQQSANVEVSHKDQHFEVPRLNNGYIGQISSDTLRPPRTNEEEEIDPNVVDTSPHYKHLQSKYDAIFPRVGQNKIAERRLLVKSLHKNEYHPIDFDNEANCPLHPSTDYPKAWKTMDIIANWNPDDTNPHPAIYQGICKFDFETDFEKIENYRKAEVPFVIQNDPDVMWTVERWSHPQFMKDMLGSKSYRAEYSENNHFMYWMVGGGRKKKNKKFVKPEGWSQPTKNIRMTFDDWLDKANSTSSKTGIHDPHWYFRLIGCGDWKNCDKKSGDEFVFNELPFFYPRKSVYMVDPAEQKGIHCRFGMRGVIAENHYDGSRNMIALINGERRYILNHPNQCPKLALYPLGHPSGRHSSIDWSDPDYGKHPEFAESLGNEIVLQAGDVLYLPTYWFHYIISLETNFQCNTRSGINNDYAQDLSDCGFSQVVRAHKK